MTKLDGTARGGVLVAAADTYGLPIHAIGVGEGMDDLRPFDAGRGGAGDRRGWRHERDAADAKPAAERRRHAWRSTTARWSSSSSPISSRPCPRRSRIFVATGVFMAAMLTAMLISQIRYGRISPLLWFSGRDGGRARRGHHLAARRDLHQDQADHLLQHRSPRCCCSASGPNRNLLKVVLGAAYPGLSERGWYLLTRNWIIFFAGMAVMNEAIWRTTSTDFWAGLEALAVHPGDLRLHRRQHADAGPPRLRRRASRPKSPPRRRSNEQGRSSRSRG